MSEVRQDEATQQFLLLSRMQERLLGTKAMNLECFRIEFTPSGQVLSLRRSRRQLPGVVRRSSECTYEAYVEDFDPHLAREKLSEIIDRISRIPNAWNIPIGGQIFTSGGLSFAAKLRPCPFCGAVPSEIQVSSQDSGGDSRRVYSIECSCGRARASAAGPWGYRTPACPGNNVDAEEKVVRRWNERHEEVVR